MGQKEIKISASSVLDLKAELSKKEAQVKQKSNPAVVTTRLKNVSKIVKKPKLDMDDEEKSKLEASFVALSRKAQLYEQKQRDQDSDDEGLVDFQMKESVDEIDTSNWVQITDEFGRTRLVKKDEIHQLEQPKNDTTDDDVRKKQMDELVQMSKETEAVKYRIQKSRNDRQKAINERLELVRLRNRKRKEAKTKMQVDNLLSSFI
ncbi:hypothetical protein HDV04_003596 [Boothiomyces sp. JEL0838]|nr:hypothetical protein HDV04_003596 [Boothiomyces sp. JEL0838]